MNASFAEESKTKMNNSAAYLMGSSSGSATTETKKSKGKKDKTKKSKKDKAGKKVSTLIGIFGKTAAMAMAAKVGLVPNSDATTAKFAVAQAQGKTEGAAKPMKASKGGKAAAAAAAAAPVAAEPVNAKGMSDEQRTAIRARALAATKSLEKRERVVETRKFAGREIQVERSVEAGGKARMPTAAPVESSGLSKVLAEIKGPQSVSTVAKSSMDWDTFKDDEGLNDELAKVTKDGMLGKKDFLNRCDVRAFEQERDVRLANAAKNVAPGKK